MDVGGVYVHRHIHVMVVVVKVSSKWRTAVGEPVYDALVLDDPLATFGVGSLIALNAFQPYDKVL